jgi:hypothetical protein
MHAGNQQALAALGGQKLDRVRNTPRRAGEHDDSVRVALEADFARLDLRGEPEEAAREHEQRDEPRRQGKKADPTGDAAKHQSIVSSVRLTVWRDVQAVTPAMSTI